MSSRRTSLFQAKSGSRRTTVVTSSLSTNVVSVSRFQSPATKGRISSPVGSPLTPGWISGRVAVFLSPKSITPPQKDRRMRRSVYIKKNVTATRKTSKVGESGASSFRMPMTKVFSPPGVKTRFRRASMYIQQGKRSPLQSSPLSVREMAAIVRSTSMESSEESSSPKRKTSKSQKGPSRKRTPSPAKRRMVKARKGSRIGKASPKVSKKASAAEAEEETVTMAASRSSRAKGSKSKIQACKRSAGSKSPSPEKSVKAGRSAKKRTRGKAAIDEEDIEEGSPAPKARRVQASSTSKRSKSVRKTPASTRGKKTSSVKRKSVKSARSKKLLANLTDNDGFLALSPLSRSRIDSSSPQKKLKFPKKFVKDLVLEFEEDEDVLLSPSRSPVKTPRATPAKRSPRSGVKSRSTTKLSRGASAKVAKDFSIESHSLSEDKSASQTSVAKFRKSTSKSPPPSKSPKKTPKSSVKEIPQSKCTTPARLSRRSTGKTSSSSRSSSIRSGSTMIPKTLAATGSGDTTPGSPSPKGTSLLSRTSLNRASIGSSKTRRSSSSSKLMTSSGKRVTTASAMCILNKNSNSSSSLQGLSSPQTIAAARSPLGRTPTSSTKKSLENATSSYRTPEKLSPPAVLSGHKRKTVLTPFYDSLSTKRRDFGRVRDYVDSPLVAGSPVGRQVATRASLNSSKRTVITSSSSSRSSSIRLGGNRRSLLNSDDSNVEMMTEEEGNGDGRELTIRQSKSWCSVM